VCEALRSESDYETARLSIFQIQSTLAADLPFIPLFSMVTYDAYRNINYPFEDVLNGVSGLYGAPSFAIPTP
jgi:ABC-type transport system substrate-binding protein